MTAPVPADGGAATGGLDEDARAALLSELASAVQAAVSADPVALYRLTDDEAGDLVYRIAENVLSLLARTRAEGATEERERIHGEIADRQHAELAGNIPPAGSPTQAYDYARRIARG